MPNKAGAYLGGIRTVEDLMQRCYVDSATECWHWRQAHSQGSPMVHVRISENPLQTVRMRGRRAAVYLGRRKDIPDGWRAYAAPCCDSWDCVNPAHARCGDRKAAGNAHRISGLAKTPAKTAAAIAQCVKRRKLTSEQVMEARRSTESNAVLAKRFGISEYPVWAARKGLTYKHLPPALPSVFDTGLP